MFTKYIKTLVYIAISYSFAYSGFAAEKLTVFVSIVPQKYFVQQIGKDLVRVQVMVKPGDNPHTYEPRPRQMATLAKTRLYFTIGVAFEDIWLKKIAAANPELITVPTDHGIDKIQMAAHHRHEDEHAHRDDDHDKANTHHARQTEDRPAEHAEHDPHIWLAPSLVKIQARTIRDALQANDPAHRADYAANYTKFEADIDHLDSELKTVFTGKQGLRFMVFHPSWGYFARDYDLIQIPIEIEGKNPKPAQLKGLIEHARENRIKVIFVQPQFSTRNAALLAREIDGQVVFADPLAADWMDNLRQVANKFKMALK